LNCWKAGNCPVSRYAGLRKQGVEKEDGETLRHISDTLDEVLAVLKKRG
jgi:hypothetical protein